MHLTDPPSGQAIFDETELRAEVVATEAVVRVEFRVDGEIVAEDAEPPFTALVDVGSENREHMIEVIVYGRNGVIGGLQRLAPPIPVHDSLEVDLQQLYVTVTAKRGKRVLDLERDDFEIFDQGRSQEISTFARGDIPFTAFLLVDGSLSMRGRRLNASLAGARRFIGGMRELDEAKVMVFSDRLLEVTPWRGAGTQLAESLNRVTADGGTSILDHLHLALTTLEGRQGRRVVILLSDGWDSLSVLSAEQVRKVARRGQALIYWVRLVGDEPGEGRALGQRTRHSLVPVRLIPTSSWRNVSDSRGSYEVLEQTVVESGGRIVSVERVVDIEQAFEDILAELREQYALGYGPDPRLNDGSWRQVRVELRLRGLKVRSRDGYVDH